MTQCQDKYHESGIAARVDNIRYTVNRFDEAMLAAAVRAVPEANGVERLLSVLDHLPNEMQGVLPELINDRAVGKIIDALAFIEDELRFYISDSDTSHLTNALEAGIQNLYQGLRRSFGYWQRGTLPAIVLADLDLRQERRHMLADKLLKTLGDWIPGSGAELHGSLGCGTADDYSGIDICWVVPDEDFAEAVDTVGAALSRVTAVLSLRTDPELAVSLRRRLLFARLARLPLFWRVDIDIRANSVAMNDLYDVGNPDARSEAEWSVPASAIENAIAAIKAAVRGQAEAVDVLLRSGCERIGHHPGSTADLADAITSLADACASQGPSLTSMAAELRLVVDRLLRSVRPDHG